MESCVNYSVGEKDHLKLFVPSQNNEEKAAVMSKTGFEPPNTTLE
jgi:hypothetical protein